MSPTVLPYNETLQNALQELHKNSFGVLATAEGNRVTARQMMLVFDGLKISCFTTNCTRKYKQISVNKNVALAFANMQIDGTASITGKTCDPKNTVFLNAVKSLFPKVYEHYQDWLENPNTTCEVIEITPKRIALFYGPPDPNRHLDVINIEERTSFRHYSSEIWPPDY